MRQREIPKPGEFYRHFKMRYYQILAVALHSETREQMVVYQALYDDFGVYVRPLAMFLSKVDREKYPDAVQAYRFERVEQPCVSVEPLERVVYRNEEDETGDVSQTEEQEKAPVQEKPPVVEEKPVDVKQEEYKIDPEVERFLDAGTYTDKLNILMSLRNHITEKQLRDMAVTLDVSIEEGDIENKFMNLVSCLRTMARFEINR